jgi:hypothetical protein
MERRILNQILLLFLFFLIFVPGCSDKSDNNDKPKDIWDIDKDGIPKFVETNYIELIDIYRISKFRSAVGHDYSDGFEQCRSMKHYFEPRNDVDWTKVKICSPVTGKITRVEQEWSGTKIEIASDDFPAFRFSIFHINLSAPFVVDDKVTSGQLLGTHIGSQTMSDISVIVNDPTRQGRMISYFEVITDDLFNEYSLRGVNMRDDMIISKAIRDANPLSCSGDTFITADTLENWVVLD